MYVAPIREVFLIRFRNVSEHIRNSDSRSHVNSEFHGAVKHTEDAPTEKVSPMINCRKNKIRFQPRAVTQRKVGSTNPRREKQATVLISEIRGTNEIRDERKDGRITFPTETFRGCFPFGWYKVT